MSGFQKYASGYRSTGIPVAICPFRIGRVYRILAAIDSSNDRVDEGSPRWIGTSLLGCFATQANRTRASRQYDPRTLVRRKSNGKKAHVQGNIR